MKRNLIYGDYFGIFKSLKIAGKVVKGVIEKEEDEISIGKKKHQRGKTTAICLKFLSGEVKKC